MFIKGNTSSATAIQQASFLQDVGAVNAILVDTRLALTAYSSGLALSIKVAFTNTGAATLSVDGMTPKAIKKAVNSNLVAGDIVAGQVIDVVFDGTNFQLKFVASAIGSGTAGTSGTSGISLSGTSGTSGVSGANGTSGTSGNSGTSGVNGTSGTSALGTPGTSGTSGANGSSGVNGTSGTSAIGTPGTSGTSGNNGTSGTSGQNGTSGSSGISLAGTAGTSGTSAINGTSGSSGTSGINGIAGDKYATTSATSITIPTTHPTARSLTIGTGLAYTVGQTVIIANSPTASFKGTITSYTSGTGALNVNSVSNFGTGTFTSWTVNLDGAPGPAGTSGTSGVSGTSGITGTSGSSGSSGVSVTGTSGTSGTSAVGIQGNAGTSGTSGAAGTSGINGTSGSSGVSASSSELITQTAHGFTVGMSVQRNSSGTWQRCQAVTTNNLSYIDGVVSQVVDANNFRIVQAGTRISLTTALTPNTVYYLAPTASGVNYTANQSDIAVGQVLREVFRTSTATVATVINGYGFVTTSGATPPPSTSLSSPNVGISDVYATSAVLSWTKPAGTTNFIVEQSTDPNFTTTAQIYSGTSQLLELSGLTPNVTYYWRVKAQGTGLTDSPWKVRKQKMFWTPTAASQGGHRIATSADLSIDPFINVGDYLIVGSDSYPENDLWGASIGGYLGLVIPALAPGAKVCILGGRGYDFITLDMRNNVGTPTNPYIITNIGGQVRARINFTNFKYCLFTGKYDPLKKTGHVDFQGFDQADWSNLQGSFGFYAKGRYEYPGVILTHVAGDTHHTTIEYIETGEGGYSGMTVKNDNGTVPMTGMVLRYCYTHDTGGEAYYLGSTQAYPQMPVIDFEMYNNVVVRAGLNGIQIGNMKGANNLHNNVVVNSGFEWNNAFMCFQDQAIQLQPRENGFIFTKNLVCGSAGDYLNWFMIPDIAHGDTPTLAQTSNVTYNLFTDNKSHGGGYMQTKDSFNGTINIANNYFGGMAKSANSANAYKGLFYTEATHSYLIGMDSINNGAATVNATNNTYDTSFAAGSPVVAENSSLITYTETGTQRVSALPVIKFNNYMDGLLDGDYSAAERWMDGICTKWVGGYTPCRNGTQFQVIRDSNATTSTSAVNIPTIHPTTVNMVIGTGFTQYKPGWKVDVTFDSTHFFKATIVSYNSGTGQLQLASVSNTGSGSFSTWSVKLDIETIVLPRVYQLGEIVRYENRFYKSLHNNNVSNQPTGNTDAHWELIIFSNGSTMPIDDVRISSTSPYAALGMGLTQNS